jgi:ribosomal protein L24
LVFVYGSDETIRDYKKGSPETVYWMMTGREPNRRKVIVTEKAMQDFIRVTQQQERQVTYFRPEELPLAKGDHIIIHGGPFDGVEGVLMKVKGHRERQLIVSIPDVAAAAVSIRPEMVEVVAHKPAKSTNAEADASELIRLSSQMLLFPPDPVQEATEYNLLYTEIRSLHDSLVDIRGYLPSLEAVISLALLLARSVLSGSSAEAVPRFRRALAALSPRSLLRVRMQLLGGLLLPDAALLSQARQAFAQWRAEGPTARQQAVIDEAEHWSHYATDSTD